LHKLIERGEVKHVSEVYIRDEENFEGALKRFNKKVQQEGILSEARRRGYYEKPSIKRKKKEAIKRRKSTKSS
jgi:small subunit ribosomal protein S21